MSRKVCAVIGNEYTTAVFVDEHELVVDEPIGAGGKDLGPSPYEMLMSALASCTAITLRMYVDRHEWPIPSIKVEVSYAREHCTDCANLDQVEDFEEYFERVIYLEGEIEKDMETRLFRIAEKCPVSKMLIGQMAIRTSLEVKG